MESSRFFYRAMYMEQSPATADYFEERTPSIFVSDSLQSWVEVFAESGLGTSDNGYLTRCDSQSRCQTHVESTEQNVDSVMGEKEEFATRRRLGYVDEAGLCLQKISHEADVRAFVSATRMHSRIIILRQRHSFSRLSITRDLFESLILDCGIFPQFKEFVLCFGVKNGENEVGPPQLRFRSSTAGLRDTEGFGFESAHVLRFVERNNRGNASSPWSLRQTAVYHQFEAAAKSSTWLFIALSTRAQSRIDSYLKANGELSPFNPFEIHLLLVDTAMANWRPYLVHLAGETNEQADRVVAASIGEESLIRVTDFVDLGQRLKQTEDNVLDLLIILNSTLDTLASLAECYQVESTQKALGMYSTRAAEQDPILFGLCEKRKDVLLYQSKVEALRAKVQGTTRLVSSLLDLGSGHSLKALAEEAKTENITMRQLTEKGFRDAVAVKVLTIVTLVYLPATVVSNFFSTQFVSQVSTNLSTHLVVASNWWIFIAASVPLTILTLYVWWFYVQKQAYGQYPYWYRTLVRVLSSSVKHLVRHNSGTQAPTYIRHPRELEDRTWR